RETRPRPHPPAAGELGDGVGRDDREGGPRMTRTAVLGLGTMGGKVAQALTEAGHEVSGFDPVAATRETAQTAGATPSDSAEGPLATAAGSVVADLSTIDPGSARRAAGLLEGHGVQYLDAPVLGRPDKIGAWTLPAGGPAEAVETIRRLLQGPVAKSVLHVG